MIPCAEDVRRGFHLPVSIHVRPPGSLFDPQEDAIICRLTSVVRTGALDVALKDWRTAGLLKPSVAHLDRIVDRGEDDIFAPVGLSQSF